jgi:hypothetical protein
MARAFCDLRRDSDVTHVATHDSPGLPDLPVKGGSTRALRITHDMMTLGIDSHVGDAARFSELAVGRRHRRVERLHAFARLLTRGQGLVPAP